MGGRRLRLAVDVGGTFTDVTLADPADGRLISAKVPTTPGDRAGGVLDGTGIAPAGGTVTLDALSTRLADLRGGQGVASGSIEILFGASRAVVDLSSAESVRDVKELIENATANAVSVDLNTSGKGLELIFTGTALTVNEVSNGRTARDLGIRKATTGGAPIIGRGVAFVGMAATVAVGVAIAVLYNTRTTALLSAIGGYLTPVLLTTGEPDQVFLFTYLSILTAGFLVLAYRKRWVFFRALTFWVVVAYFGGWWTAEGVGLPWAMLLYTSVMFLFFSAEIVAWSAFRGVVDEGWSYVVLGLNTTLHVLVGLTVLAS